MQTHFAAIPVIVMATSLIGCVSSSYQYGASDPDPRTTPLVDQFERGQANALLDGVGWVIGIPGKIILWDRRVDNHHISPETEQALAEYMTSNSLVQTKVRLNQYDPLGEWRRLTENDRVSGGWRYTLGALSTLGYTVFPGRLFGGDHYNPFTNTVHLYSDHAAIALHEGAHAKDILGRQLPGTYAAAYALPVVSLWHEERATSDVLSYLHAEDSPEDLQAAYRILYPAYGTHVAGQLSRFIPEPFSLGITAACVIPGHITGRIKASQVPTNRMLADANPLPSSLAGNPLPRRRADSAALDTNPTAAMDVTSSLK